MVYRALTALLVGLWAVPVGAQGVSPRPTLAQMGIPAPGWDWETTVLAEYGDADFVTHYFDNTGTCNDANAPGTIASPMCNPPTMTSLAAGSVVQGCGTYSRSTDLTITASGTNADPVFFQARQASACPGGLTITFTGSGNMLWSNSTNLIIRGVTWTAVEGAVCSSCDEITIMWCIVNGTGTTADSGAMLSFAGSTNVVRAYNYVRDGGDDTNANENDTHCLSIGSSLSNIWDLWNTVERCSGDGWGNAHEANQTTFNLYAGGNIFSAHRENCIDLKEAHDVILSWNQCDTLQDSAALGGPGPHSHGEGFVIHSSTSNAGAYNVWMHKNLCIDVVSCFVVGNADTGAARAVYAIGNIARDCHASDTPGNDSGFAATISGGSTATYHIYHNTFEGCSFGVLLTNTVFAGVNAGGNIYSNLSQGHFYVGSKEDVVTISKELLYQGGAAISITWDTSTFTSVAAAIAGTAQWDDSLQADPLFTNEAANTFTLQSSSPAINVGADMSALETTYAGLFGTSLLYDRDGNARPNGVWDMGAYEWVADAASPAAKPVYRLRQRGDDE